MMTRTLAEPWMEPHTDSPYHAPEVAQWVAAAQGGDTLAFGRLVERFQRDVYGKAFAILRNHGDADDVVQETFLRAFRALPGFRFESSFRTWLVTIATRQALNYRERERMDHDPLEGPGEGLEHPALRVDEVQMAALLDEESRRLLREALPRLPKRQREALELKLQHDWPHERIAQAMGTTVGSVKSHIFHAIRALTAHLAGGHP